MPATGSEATGRRGAKLGRLLWLLALWAGGAGAQPARREAPPVAFLRVVPSLDGVYVGQAFSVSYLLFYRAPIIDPNEAVALRFGNCHAEEYPPTTMERTATVGGRPYRVRVLKQYLLVPQLAGALQLPALVQHYRRNAPPAADDFFGQPRLVSLTVRAAGRRVLVRALPPLPAGSVPFAHAVGQFTFSPTYTVASGAGNQLTVRLRLAGAASLHQLQLPPPPLPAGVEAYHVRSQAQHALTARGLRATGAYSYDAVARYRGTYTLAGPALRYFDPLAGRYKTYQAPAFRWLVRQGPPPPARLAASPAPGLALQPDLFGSQSGRLFLGSRAYYGLWLLGSLIFAAGLAYARQQRAHRAPAYHRRRAQRRALQALATHERAHPHNPDQFYKGLGEVLAAYIDARFGAAGGEVGAANPLAALQAAGVPAGVRARARALLALLDQQRFAPAPPAVGRRGCQEEVVALIHQLETSCRHA